MLVDATRKYPMAPLALPTREYMEHARALWEELDLYPLSVQSPWHGYGLGDWTDRWETFARRAATGDWELTGRDIPQAPSMFARLVDTLVGHEGEMIRPTVSACFDFEGELAIVIGRAGRHIRPERALDHVAGYTCFVDGSVRDYQKFSVTSGKNFPATGPLGPWIVTTDEITDPARLMLTTRLNGQEVQKSATDLLIYSVPQIIAFCSEFTPLVPGDVIATGTPEGVGHRRNPPLWMKPGDVLEVEISGIGTLRNRVVDEKA